MLDCHMMLESSDELLRQTGLTCCRGGRALVAGPPDTPRPPPPVGRSRLERRIRRAKRAARSELSVSRGGWTQHGFASPASTLLSTQGVVDTLPRVDGRGLTQAQFAEQWEVPRRPCALTHLTEGWRAAREWAPEGLLAKCSSHRFKVGPGLQTVEAAKGGGGGGAAGRCDCTPRGAGQNRQRAAGRGALPAHSPPALLQAGSDSWAPCPPHALSMPAGGQRRRRLRSAPAAAPLPQLLQPPCSRRRGRQVGGGAGERWRAATARRGLLSPRTARLRPPARPPRPRPPRLFQPTSPLYIFDGGFADKPSSACLRGDYEVPEVGCRQKVERGLPPAVPPACHPVSAPSQPGGCAAKRRPMRRTLSQQHFCSPTRLKRRSLQRTSCATRASAGGRPTGAC